MENDLLQALVRASKPPRSPRSGPGGFVVVEKGYSAERVVFRTANREDAERVASQHAARRVVEV